MKVAERLARLAIIAITCVVVVIAGCDRAMTAGKTVMPTDPVESPITPEELLAFPDVTDEEFDQWWEMVRAAAVNVNLLDVTGCTPNPLVIEVDHGESIAIYNDDATDHTLSWGGHSITIPAGETIDIVVSDVFPTGGGVLGYGCEDGGTDGIFYVRSPPVEPPPINPLLVFPGEDATPEEFDRHAELVRAAAVNVNLLDITGCTPNPLVIEVGIGEYIAIKNSDDVAHTLTHGGGSITIPAGGATGLVVSEFGDKLEGGGIAGYGCDGQTAGIFYVNSNLVVESPITQEELVSAFPPWPPAKDATAEEYRQFWWEMVDAAAVNVNVLDIAGCTPDPLIIKMELGESITVKNSGTNDNTLHWGGGEHSITIPAGGTIDFVVSSDNGFGVGASGYRCNDVVAGIFDVVAGMFYVVEPPVEPSE